MYCAWALRQAMTNGEVLFTSDEHFCVAGDGKHHHFLSRYWAPWLGVGEDAVTGSLHTVLTPYWDATLQMGSKPMKARQCSPRGGELQVTYAADEKAVYIAGEAVIMAKGHLLLPLSDD